LANNSLPCLSLSLSVSLSRESHFFHFLFFKVSTSFLHTALHPCPAELCSNPEEINCGHLALSCFFSTRLSIVSLYIPIAAVQNYWYFQYHNIIIILLLSRHHCHPQPLSRVSKGQRSRNFLLLLFEAASVQPFLLLSLPSACFCRTRASIHLLLTCFPFPRPNAFFSCAPPTETPPFPISPLQYFYFFSSPPFLPSPHPHFCSKTSALLTGYTILPVVPTYIQHRRLYPVPIHTGLSPSLPVHHLAYYASSKNSHIIFVDLGCLGLGAVGCFLFFR